MTFEELLKASEQTIANAVEHAKKFTQESSARAAIVIAEAQQRAKAITEQAMRVAKQITIDAELQSIIQAEHAKTLVARQAVRHADMVHKNWLIAQHEAEILRIQATIAQEEKDIAVMNAEIAQNQQALLKHGIVFDSLFVLAEGKTFLGPNTVAFQEFIKLDDLSRQLRYRIHDLKKLLPAQIAAHKKNIVYYQKKLQQHPEAKKEYLELIECSEKAIAIEKQLLVLEKTKEINDDKKEQYRAISCNEDFIRACQSLIAGYQKQIAEEQQKIARIRNPRFVPPPFVARNALQYAPQQEVFPENLDKRYQIEKLPRYRLNEKTVALKTFYPLYKYDDVKGTRKQASRVIRELLLRELECMNMLHATGRAPEVYGFFYASVDKPKNDTTDGIAQIIVEYMAYDNSEEYFNTLLFLLEYVTKDRRFYSLIADGTLNEREDSLFINQNGKFDKFFFITLVLEHMSGGSLHDALILRKLSTQQLIKAAYDIASHIQYLVAVLDCIHSDIKPSNIMFDDAMCVKIIDFGSAFLRGIPGQGFSPLYSAPEVAYSLEDRLKADVFSFGMTLLEMFQSPVDNFLKSLDGHRHRFIGIRGLLEQTQYPPSVRYLIASCLQLHSELRPTLEQIKDYLTFIIENRQRDIQLWQQQQERKITVYATQLAWQVINTNGIPFGHSGDVFVENRAVDFAHFLNLLDKAELDEDPLRVVVTRLINEYPKIFETLFVEAETHPKDKRALTAFADELRIQVKPGKISKQEILDKIEANWLSRIQPALAVKAAEAKKYAAWTHKEWVAYLSDEIRLSLTEIINDIGALDCEEGKKVLLYLLNDTTLFRLIFEVDNEANRLKNFENFKEYMERAPFPEERRYYINLLDELWDLHLRIPDPLLEKKRQRALQFIALVSDENDPKQMSKLLNWSGIYSVSGAVVFRLAIDLSAHKIKESYELIKLLLASKVYAEILHYDTWFYLDLKEDQSGFRRSTHYEKSGEFYVELVKHVTHRVLNKEPIPMPAFRPESIFASLIAKCASYWGEVSCIEDGPQYLTNTYNNERIRLRALQERLMIGFEGTKRDVTKDKPVVKSGFASTSFFVTKHKTRVAVAAEIDPDVPPLPLS